MTKKKTKKTSLGKLAFQPTAPAPDVIKTPMMRVSGHFVDQKLEPLLPRPYQSSLFDLISSDEIKGEIQEQGITEVGITFTPSEEKLVYALVALLKDKSENKDENSASFYKGNYAKAELTDWGGQETRIPTIEISQADLYKAYMGTPNYSGKDISEVNKTLASLSNKKFLLRYERKRKVQVGKGKEETRTDIIEKYSPLIAIINVTKDLTDEEVVKYKEGDDKVRQAKGKLVIAINPIFTDQIKDKYVLLPCNVTQMTEMAAGNPRAVTTAMTMLRDYLAREISAKRYTPEINKETLIYQLHLTKFKSEGRRTYVETRINDAIKACTNMGIILSHEIKLGAQGQEKYVFTLNKDLSLVLDFAGQQNY